MGFLQTVWIFGSATIVLSAGLSILPRIGAFGRSISDWLCRAPMLDVIVAMLTWVPWVFGLVLFGWRGMIGALVGQLIGLGVWVMGHELVYREATRGPRIVKFINRTVGRWRNHAALWVKMLALPGFWFIRLIQYASYPFLVWILKFPKYRHADWVNVSRQKFEGLVGHDLIWCLYCDWMTGVYSLGAEMLRNVESFWCPIRFYEGKKCDNCKTDFPDIDNGWVSSDGTMQDVERVLEQQYGDGRREWFGHPARLTVRGGPIERDANESGPR